MSSSRNDFTNLKRLLPCKRYEQPTPDFFNDFSTQVISRLEADEFVEYSSWWQWLVNKFDAKPVVACLYALSVSGLLLAGFRLSQVFENEVAATPVLGSPWLAATPPSTSIWPSEAGQSTLLDISGSPISLGANAIFGAEPAGLLLNEDRRFRVQPASLSLGGQ